ncbi:hypothetical protein KPL78_15315 [Roseomonas sp. HJA6]|uniref:Uncharacterized protein n=1 Tax=Roseomonas alba TaxID=2846776 RepID=A0ABS7AD48_9PROT|nr:hypothetical protein [Neoroseomonas alba]MBW6399230.1 hypothetical protein [Neoroseomonas alba]
MAIVTTVHPGIVSSEPWTAIVVTPSDQIVPGDGRASPYAAGLPMLRDAITGSRQLLMPALGFAAGMALAGALVGVGHLRARPVDAIDAGQESLQTRVARLEAMVDELAAATDNAVAALQASDQNVTARGLENSRFIAAALLLQAAVATPRPWPREYQAMVTLAPPGALPRPLAEVLLSHAARGLPTEAELRERYAALMPQLIERAPRDASLVERSFTAMRNAFAGVGLAAPPAATDQEQAIAGVAQQLRRGNLSAAVVDAGALHPSLQPLLAGWLAQAGARLAVEQAVQETLLRALTTPPRPI